MEFLRKIVVAITVVLVLSFTEETQAVTCLPQGNRILCRLEATGDVWLETPSNNYGNYDFLIVGKHPGYPLKRTLIQFEDIPQTCKKIESASMNVYYWYAYKTSWLTDAQAPFISRPIEVRQVLKNWKESEANSGCPFNGASWSRPYLGLDGTDAKSFIDDTQTVSKETGHGFITWDITTTASNWIAGQQNYGVVISVSNEDTIGRDIRFFSRERLSNKPYLSVLCSDENEDDDCKGHEDIFLGCYIKCASNAVKLANSN